jgi:hypothetical protein
MSSVVLPLDASQLELGASLKQTATPEKPNVDLLVPVDRGSPAAGSSSATIKSSGELTRRGFP